MINKKDSGATVLHLPLSEKTKPVDGLMTDYCSNIQFFSTTEQIIAIYYALVPFFYYNM